MRKFVVIAIVVAVVGGAAAYMGVFSRGGEAATGTQAGGPGAAPGGGQGGRGGPARAARPAVAAWAGSVDPEVAVRACR
jgi:hypothetical protein